MRFLVHWKMRPAEAKEVLKLLDKDLKFCMDLMDEGKLLKSNVLAGKPEGLNYLKLRAMKRCIR